MSYYFFDPDEWENVIESRPCGCAGKRNGMCNGMLSVSQRRRDPAEIAKIKEAKRFAHEEDILKEARAIIDRRSRVVA